MPKPVATVTAVTNGLFVLNSALKHRTRLNWAALYHAAF
jgi:hypothetical protein